MVVLRREQVCSSLIILQLCIDLVYIAPSDVSANVTTGSPQIGLMYVTSFAYITIQKSSVYLASLSMGKQWYSYMLFM